jgi:hypothetical protein
MELIFGTLSIDEPQLTSLLESGDQWLLLAGFPDPNQAGHAATNFIVNVRQLSNGESVAVTGTRNTIGTQPVIIMTDINAAGSLMEHAMKLATKGKVPDGHSKNLSSGLDTQTKKAARTTPLKKNKSGGQE